MGVMLHDESSKFKVQSSKSKIQASLTTPAGPLHAPLPQKKKLRCRERKKFKVQSPPLNFEP
jgi:hypothetical protein